jgi:hypothetical protein
VFAFPKSNDCLPIVQSNHSYTLRNTDTFFFPISDGYNYSTLTVWNSRGAFDNWRASSANANARKKEKTTETEPMFDGPPSPVLYEGVLALLSGKGA